VLFTIREYGVIEDNGTNTEMMVPTQLDRIKVPSSVFDYLCELAGQYKKMGSIFEIEGRRTLKVDNFVGIILRRVGTIEILPKHVDIQTQDQKEEVLANERQLLRKMLEALWKPTCS
jgi:5-methylcytosine-specific restriction enzyme subunit McrC